MTHKPVIVLEPADYSAYGRINIIGNIHGCFTVLKQALGELKDDQLYIFLGDFLDRGTENAEVLNFIISIRDRKNCHFIEGNHESNLKNYAEEKEFRGSDFKYKTLPQIKDIDRKDIRMFCRRLRQCEYFTWNGRRFLVCHGGIPALPPAGLIGVSTYDLINGTGSYDDYAAVAEAWHRTQSSDFIQVFGHRNTGNDPAMLHDNVYCLEGKVECGGNLRILEIDENGITPREYKNTVFDPAYGLGVPALIQNLRKNRYITEKNFGTISSFNFTRNAFEKGIWNEQTVTARGLFIDIYSGTIVARGYRKFFNIDEREETKFNVLADTMSFPAKVYVKENGFLGLVSVYNGEIFTTSKSNPFAEYADYFRNVLNSSCRDMEYLKKYLTENRVTLVMECIDTVNDPHIIKYSESKVVLLDIVDNDLEFTHRSYEELKQVGERLGIEVKTAACTLNSAEEFKSWYREQQQETLDPLIGHIEGYVIEDAKGYMVKIKLPFYSFWKHMRTAAEIALKKEPETRRLNKKGKRFVDWLKVKIEEGLDKVRIIELREQYIKETGDRMTD